MLRIYSKAKLEKFFIQLPDATIFLMDVDEKKVKVVVGMAPIKPMSAKVHIEF
jgi:hypothetical protein